MHQSVKTIDPHNAAVFSISYPVLSHNVDPYGAMRIDALTGLLHETAWRHAEKAGMGFNALAHQGVLWIVARFRIHCFKYPMRGDQIMVCTWPRSANRIAAFRDFQVLDNQGSVICIAGGQWLIIDKKTRKPVNMTSYHQFFDFYNQPVFSKSFSRLPGATQSADSHEETVQWSDLDFNQHVNNLNYIRWSLNALPHKLLKSHKILDIEINFTGEGQLGDSILTLIAPVRTKQNYDVSVLQKSSRIELSRLHLQLAERRRLNHEK